MNDKQKREKLKKLQGVLMEKRGKTKGNTLGTKGNQEGISNNMWVIRKQIAILKTSLNVKGYNYHPRGI